VTAAVGSNRYRVTFSGPGGHSFSAFGTVNPAWALGDFLQGMARIDVPAHPMTTYCASIFGGGSSINAIPEAVWVDIDLRSQSATELDRIDGQMKQLALMAVETENRRNNCDNGKIRVSIDQIGQRPAGATPEDSRIVATALAAIRAFGFSPETTASSTDANIPMSLGIPAVTFGNGGTSGRAHSLDEWIDVEAELSLRGLSAALAAIIGTAALRAD
jgi:tripeptide aminopeptidase